jgi:hypothetical protein
MSSKELQRLEVLSRVASKALKLVNAAKIMRLSYRQTKRLWRRYQQSGPEGLKHGNAGRQSNRAKPERFRRKVLKLVREKYGGAVGERFGPTLAAEHLAEEDGLRVDEETLRRWMLAEGLWTRERKRKAHHQRREAKEHFGELVQMDGSFHDWFEGRGPRGCLMNMVDDATGTTLARIGEQETIWAAVGVLEAWIVRYGVPCALYTDWKNVYVREATPTEQMRGEVPLTQFGRMCAELRIKIIAASSPQAKGRVERNHGTHQDRLVKKLRRKRIQSYAAANEYLMAEYLPEHNRRFAHAPASPEDYHRRAPRRAELRHIFLLETKRSVSNDWVVRYAGRYLQLKPQQHHRGPTQARAVVCEWEDGRLEVHYRGERITFEELSGPSMRTVKELPSASMKKMAVRVRPNPAPNHPWRRSYKQIGVAVPTVTPPRFETRPCASP